MASYRAKPPKGSPLQRGQPLAKGLRLAYLFGEAGGVVAPDAVGRWPGTLTGTATWTTSPYGRALSFDGASGYVLVGSSFAPGGTSRTVAALISSTQSSSLKYVLDSQAGRFTAAWNSNSAGKLGVQDNVGWHSFGNAPNDGLYHLIHWVCDGAAGLCRGFVDGKQLGTDQAYTPVACGGRTTLMTDSNGPPPGGSYVPGALAGLWFWDWALPAQLIRQQAADPFVPFRRRSVPVPLRAPAAPQNRSVTGKPSDAVTATGNPSAGRTVTARPPNP